MDTLPPPPTIPRLDINRISASERENAWHLQALLHLLDAFVVRFEGALRLNEHCRELGQTYAKEANTLGISEDLFTRISEQLSWRLIAGREAAMAIYHFSCTLESISTAVHKCPSVKARLKHRPFKIARQLFNKHFPHAEVMRHAISHTAEMAATVESLKENASKTRRVMSAPKPEDSIALAIGPSFSGNRLTLSHKGKDVSVEVTSSNREKLCLVAALVYVQFRQLADIESRQQPVNDF